MQTINRFQPALPVSQMKTYRIDAPISTHFRKATCKEIGCQAYANGWVSYVDESTDLGKAQAGYIRHQAGRAFTERKEGALTAFVFAAEQKCFREHQTRLDRLESFSVHKGDWRANLGGQQVLQPGSWVESQQTDFDALRRAKDRG